MNLPRTSYKITGAMRLVCGDGGSLMIPFASAIRLGLNEDTTFNGNPLNLSFSSREKGKLRHFLDRRNISGIYDENNGLGIPHLSFWTHYKVNNLPFQYYYTLSLTGTKVSKTGREIREFSGDWRLFRRRVFHAGKTLE